MKKIFTFIACAAFAFSSLCGFSQTDKKASGKKTETKKETGTDAKPAATNDGAKLKKDGTPDKRYKENKTAAEPAGPTKKDGTPDKRYNANKKK